MSRITLSLATAALTTTLALTGCTGSISFGTLFGSPSVKKADVESRLTTEIANQTQTQPTVTCPGDLEGTKGASMECTATIDGVRYPVQVTVTDVQDRQVNYHFKMAGDPKAEPTTGPTQTPNSAPTSAPSSEPSEPSGDPAPAGPDEVSKLDVGLAIQARIHEQTGNSVLVECPRHLKAEIGASMVCKWSSLLGDETGRMEVTVTEISSDKRVTFRFRDL